MASNKRSAPRRKAKGAEAAPATSAIRIVARNLLNMAVVMASSGTVLLTLMIVRKF